MKKSNSPDGLLNKIHDRKASVGIIGLGSVGLPLIREFSRAGFPVRGFDIDRQKVSMLASSKSYIKHIPSQDIKKLLNSGRFHATTDITRLFYA